MSTETMDSGYSAQILQRFAEPQNVGSLNAADPSVGSGQAGIPGKGGVIRVQFRADTKQCIVIARFKAYGGPAYIAAGCLLTEYLTGKTVAQAATIDDRQIAQALALPPLQIRCAVLAVEALQAALRNYTAKRTDAKRVT